MLFPLLAASLSAQAAPARLFSCEQITIVDPPMMEHLDLAFDETDMLIGARVTRVQSGIVQLETKTPSPKPNYDNGYWLDNYGLEAYKVGVVGGWTTYIVLIPAFGVLGSQFDAQLHLYFDKGAAGWWPNEFECVEVF